jgi:D-alanine-D-alanine ligase
MKIDIIYNDPLQYATGKIYDDGVTDIEKVPGPIDMSEYGVIDEMKAVQRALKPSGHEVNIVPVALDILKLIEHLKNNPPDMIFNLCESVDGDPTQEMNIAALFELLKVPYTGSRALTLGIALNKSRVKEILNFYHIPTAAHYICAEADKFMENGFERVKDKFPLIVKPSREDASIGIDNDSVVRNETLLKKRIQYIIEEYKQPALVEEFIEGREINVSVVGNYKNSDDDITVFPISEIDFTGLPENLPKIVSYNSKWMYKTPEFEFTKAVCPAKNLSPELEKKIQYYAKQVYRIVGAADYARVDFRVKGDTPYVLELNPNPDISSDVDSDTGFTRSGKAYGWTYEELIQNIIGFASERWGVKVK